MDLIAMNLLEQLHEKVLHSKVEEALIILKKLWAKEHTAIEILETLHPISLFTFSHRFSTIHVPKEHEYLYRLFKQIPTYEHIDFLNRFVEYLAWSSKYIIDASNSITSGPESKDSKQAYLSAMKSHKGLAAFFSALKMIEQKGLEDTFKLILQIGCNNISQSIGHYFSCIDSVVKLGLKVGMPQAKNHIFGLTLYLMQSAPIIMTTYQNPSQTLDEILIKLVRKGGFFGYHYMILANGLIRNKDFIGEKHYLHALHGLESILPELNDTLSINQLDSMVQNIPYSNDPLKDLKEYIWKGEKLNAFTTLRQYLNREWVTSELTAAIAHSYTKIDVHPHDPHYVTFPTSAFELIPYLNEDSTELILAHSIEFAVDRVLRHGVMP